MERAKSTKDYVVTQDVTVSADQGFSTVSQGSRHMHGSSRWTHPPPPIPPFLLAQNLSWKQIAANWKHAAKVAWRVHSPSVLKGLKWSGLNCSLQVALMWFGKWNTSIIFCTFIYSLLYGGGSVKGFWVIFISGIQWLWILYAYAQSQVVWSYFPITYCKVWGHNTAWSW